MNTNFEEMFYKRYSDGQIMDQRSESDEEDCTGADAQFCRGLSYANGWEVDKNHCIAVEWYEKATAQNHAKSYYCLGICYDKGLGVCENKAIAQKYFKKATELGYN
jgi:TPR repeat protein